MTEGQALDYFNSRLNKGTLQAGTSYMIDKEDNVFECVTWASGGIWFIKQHKPTEEHYQKERQRALFKRSTEFEER